MTRTQKINLVKEMIGKKVGMYTVKAVDELGNVVVDFGGYTGILSPSALLNQEAEKKAWEAKRAAARELLFS